MSNLLITNQRKGKQQAARKGPRKIKRGKGKDAREGCKGRVQWKGAREG